MQNWRDLATTAYLYEAQSGGNVELMLQRTPTNSRENEQLARFGSWLDAATGYWTGNYHKLWGDITVKWQEHYLVMDAFSRKQAIELAGVVAKAEAVQMGADGQVKRGGLLGLLGIK